MKMNSKEAIAWYEKHIPEAAITAHRMMMRGDYGGEPVYFWYKPNGLSIRVARGEVKGPTGHKLVTKEHAPRNLEQAQLVRWLIDRTRRLELFPKEDGTEGLDGVGKGTRKGTRVRFAAHPGSLVLYSHHPEIGEEGTVGTMPGFGKRTYLPGPGGGLLYVDWDQSGMIGVSPNDVEKVKAKQSGLGDVTRVGKVGKAPPGPPSGFGKEKTREDYRKRIDWEGWAAAKAREDGHEAVAQGHDMARADYVTNYELKVNGGLRGLDGVPDIDDFTRGYVEAALWSSTDAVGEPLDKTYDLSDIADETWHKILKDTEKFQRANAKDLSPFGSARAGHDFWLTRNGHGAGFWDGDYPEPQATRLTKASEAFKGVDLYVGNDGKKLYLSP